MPCRRTSSCAWPVADGGRSSLVSLIFWPAFSGGAPLLPSPCRRLVQHVGVASRHNWMNRFVRRPPSLNQDQGRARSEIAVMADHATVRIFVVDQSLPQCRGYSSPRNRWGRLVPGTRRFDGRPSTLGEQQPARSPPANTYHRDACCALRKNLHNRLPTCLIHLRRPRPDVSARPRLVRTALGHAVRWRIRHGAGFILIRPLIRLAPPDADLHITSLGHDLLPTLRYGD